MVEKSESEQKEVVTPDVIEANTGVVTPEGAVSGDTGTETTPEPTVSAPKAKAEETPEPKIEATVLGKALAEDADRTGKEAALGGKDKKEAPSAQEQAPVEYVDFTAPEGVEISPTDMARAKEAFAEARLPQDQAQKYLDMHLSEVERHVRASQQHQVDQWMATRKKWQEDFQTDQEIGGNKVNTTLEASRGLIRKYGTPGLIDAINVTGVGDHPEFIRFLSRLSETHQETSKVVEAMPVTTEERAARRYKASA